MKISIQENLLPGETLNEKLDCAESLGIDGVEVQGRSRLYDRIGEYEAAFRNRTLRISSICGQTTFDWLDPDRAKREASIDESRRNLEACGYFGAAGQIVPPIFGPPRLPDLSPLKDAVALEKELLVEITRDLAAFADSHGTLLLLEPLNRYEQHLLRRQEDGVEIIEKAGSPRGVALLTDFFHMHIEEVDTPATDPQGRAVHRPYPFGGQYARSAGRGRHRLAGRHSGPGRHRLRRLSGLRMPDCR